jgi:hypothetical protein
VLEYSAGVKADATAGQRLEFDTTLRTSAGEQSVTGPSDLTVMTPFLRGALDGPLSQETLDAASEKAKNGDLTKDELEVLYGRWLDAEEAEPSEARTRSDGGDEDVE